MAMERQTTVIRWPLGGMDSRVAYQDQQPNTTVDCANVRPEDTSEGRERGGSRPGVAKLFAENVGGTIQLLAVVEVTDAVTGLPERSLFVASGGQAYASENGALIAVGGNLLAEDGNDLLAEDGSNILVSATSLDSTHAECAAQRGENLLIADYGATKSTGTDGVLASNVLTSLSAGSFTAAGVDPDLDVVLLEPVGGSSVVTGTYDIVGVTASSVTIAGTCPDGLCSFTIARCPKIYEPANNRLVKLVATTGNAPTGCPVVAVYRDRAVWALGRVWYMSRQGDHLDYNYGADAADAGRAVAATNADAGQLGMAIVAIVPHGDDYLIFFGEDQTWVLRGDPVAGGQLDAISRSVGIVGRQAWCYGPDGEVLFLSRDGLYVIDYGAQSEPRSLSREKIPRALTDISRETYDVSMSYDTTDQGVHIFLTPVDGSAGVFWWFDWETKSLWPQFFTTDAHQPTRAIPFAETPSTRRRAAIASRDGYVRVFDYNQVTDDGTDVTSWIYFGPFRLSDDLTDGLITELGVTLDPDSAAVTVSVRASDNAENTILAPARFSASTIAGRGTVFRPRVRGGAATVKIGATGQWYFERAWFNSARSGLSRPK